MIKIFILVKFNETLKIINNVVKKDFFQLFHSRRDWCNINQRKVVYWQNNFNKISTQ